jgi:hypothetical protein
MRLAGSNRIITLKQNDLYHETNGTRFREPGCRFEEREGARLIIHPSQTSSKERG